MILCPVTNSLPLPSYKVNQSSETAYFENRIGCSGANPYLVMAATVAAGIDGLVKKLVPPPEKMQEGAGLPRSLEEALQALEDDKVIHAALGEEFITWFGIMKRDEIRDVTRKTELEDDLQAESERLFYLDRL